MVLRRSNWKLLQMEQRSREVDEAPFGGAEALFYIFCSASGPRGLFHAKPRQLRPFFAAEDMTVRPSVLVSGHSSGYSLFPEDRKATIGQNRGSPPQLPLLAVLQSAACVTCGSPKKGIYASCWGLRYRAGAVMQPLRIHPFLRLCCCLPLIQFVRPSRLKQPVAPAVVVSMTILWFHGLLAVGIHSSESVGAHRTEFDGTRSDGYSKYRSTGMDTIQQFLGDELRLAWVRCCMGAAPNGR